MTLFRLDELSAAGFEARLAANPLVILPFGTTEWHSYHLPVGLDSLVAQQLSEEIAERFGAVLGPLTPWAVGGVPYPHTIRFAPDLIEKLMSSIFEQMSLLGFQTVLALTGHFGLEQTLALKRAAFQVMRRSPLTIWAGGEFEPVAGLGYLGDHAAKWETALLHALRPDLVDIDNISPETKLDGILGEDPRMVDYKTLGVEIHTQIIEAWSHIGEYLPRLNRLQREQYIEALGIGVRILEKITAERAIKPKSQVPSLNTRSYIAYLVALAGGDYPTAQIAAAMKLSNLAD